MSELTIVDRELVLDFLFEQRHDILDDVLSLGLEMLVVGGPVSRRNGNQVSVLHKAPELRSRMDFLPLLHDEVVKIFLVQFFEIFFADCRRLQQLINVGQVINAQRLACGDPNRIFRAVPVGFYESRST